MSQKWAKSNYELPPSVGRYLRKAALKLFFFFIFLFCLLEQIEVLYSRYEQYLLLLFTMYMYIDSLERRAAEF